MIFRWEFYGKCVVSRYWYNYVQNEKINGFMLSFDSG